LTLTLLTVAVRRGGLGGLFGIMRLLGCAVLAGALCTAAFLLTFFVEAFFLATFFLLGAFFLATLFVESFFLATFFLLTAFFLLTFFFAGGFLLETFRVLARFFAAGFFLLTFLLVLDFFAACIFRLTFFFVAFLVDFLPAGFFRAAVFFFGAFFADAFFRVTLDFFAVVFFLPTDCRLAAFFPEAFAGFRFLLAVFFAGIFLLLPVREKRGIIHWFPAHGSSKNRLFSVFVLDPVFLLIRDRQMALQTMLDQHLSRFRSGIYFA